MSIWLPVANKLPERIDSLSKKASGEAQTVSAATEEQSASMEQIGASNQELAKMAQVLQEAVVKFQDLG